MTLEELAKELNLSISTLVNAFPRTQKAFIKRGILIKKHGRGEDATYSIERIKKEEE